MEDHRHWDAVEEAVELLRERDYSLAESALDDALKADSDNPYAWFYLGVVHFEQGQHDKSAIAYGEALKRSPNYLGAAVGLGHCMRLLGRHDDALRAGQLALDIARNNGTTEDGDAHWLIALTFAAKKDATRAIRHAELFLASRPELEAQADAEAMIQSLREKARHLHSVS
ncbi:MAG: tetratricopeptide repeat protein [Deltaproteobacteria bacterium]|nr:tetratricopeptide repeat protein [Deltaproteobacteria bacterium]